MVLQIFDVNKINTICYNYKSMKKKNLDLSKILEHHENIFNEFNKKLENILNISRENESDKKKQKKQKYPKAKKLKEKNMIIVNIFNQPMD